VLLQVSLVLALVACTVILLCFFLLKTNRYSLLVVGLPLALLPALSAWFSSSYQLIRTFQAMAEEENDSFEHVSGALMESNQIAQIGYTSTLLPLIVLLILGTVLLIRKDDVTSELARPFHAVVVVVAAAVFLLLAGASASVGIRAVALPLPVIAHDDSWKDPDLPMMIEAKEALDLENSPIEKVSEQIADALVGVAYGSVLLLTIGLICYMVGLGLSLSFSYSRTTLVVGWVFTLVALAGTGTQIGRHRALEQEILRVVDRFTESQEEEIPPGNSSSESNER
jgi:hypothetical protein